MQLHRQKNISLIILLCFLRGGLSSHAQAWQWAKGPTCGSVNGGSEGWLVKNDASNNVYVAGYYYGLSICFGAHTFYNPINSANTTQTVVIKYDSTGNILWAEASTRGQSKPISITTDAAGNLFVFGIFTTDTAWFGSTAIANRGFDTTDPLANKAFYLLKYNSTGTLLWARAGATNIHPTANALHPGGVALDKAGNVYVTGTYNSPLFVVGNDTVYNAGTGSTNDIFLAKYAGDGTLIWLRSFGGLKDDYVTDLATSHDNKLYMSGYFNSGFIRFGSTTLYTQFEKAFVACLDTAARSVWANCAETKSRAEAITVDNNNEACIVGGFRDTISFGDFFFHNPNGGYYLLKFDANGNVKTGKTMYFNSVVNPCCFAYGITTDKCNNTWLSANMDKTAGLVLADGTAINAPAGSADPMFIAGYNAAGRLIDYAALPSGAGNNTGLANTGLSADTSGNIYLSGDYRLLNPFMIGSNPLYIYSGAIATIFVAKYKPNNGCDTVVTPPPAYPDVPIITINPNPAAYECVLDYNGSLGTGAASAAIRDITGRLIATYPITGRQTLLDVSYLAQGVYTCIVKVGDHPLYTILLVVIK